MSEIVENVTQNCNFMICYVCEEQSTKVSTNIMPKGLFTYKAEKVTGGLQNLHN
jgi:hypothetical protein